MPDLMGHCWPQALLTQHLCPAGLDSDDATEAMVDGISYGSQTHQVLLLTLWLLDNLLETYS